MPSTNSKRYQISNAFLNAISTSTIINFATNKMNMWTDYDISKFPLCIITDEETSISKLAFDSTTLEDRECKLGLLVRGVVHDINNDYDLKVTDLIREVDKKIYASTTLKSLIKDVMMEKVETNNGALDNFGIADMHYSIIYHFNHLAP